MNEIYSKVVIARFKRSSARPTGCPVAFRIEAGALGLDLNVLSSAQHKLEIHAKSSRRNAQVRRLTQCKVSNDMRIAFGIAEDFAQVEDPHSIAVATKTTCTL